MAFSAPALAAPDPTVFPKATIDSSLQGPKEDFLGLSYINPNPTSTIQSLTNTINIAAGTYSFWMAGFSTLGSGGSSATGIFTATLSDGVGEAIKTLTFSLTGKTDYLAYYWDNLDLAAGTYSIKIEGAHLGGNGATEAAAGLRNDTVAVPGPEAGAGLGALALGGMALYMKRRRKDEVAAA